MAAVILKNIQAGYGENSVLRDFSLFAEDGELVALLGASGCGKTTVLKIIAGLHEAEAGEIQLDGKNITNIPAEKRGTAMVFQKPLLFPYLTVAENIAFGLKMRNLAKNEIREKVAENLQLVQLEGFETRLPHQLSGGQEQRVSLARALVTNPRILLLDEPFSALDAELRVEMRNLVRKLQRRLKITTVFVTHDQEEAVALADRIAFIDGGELVQIDRPNEFYVNPKNLAAAKFFGWKILDGEFGENSVENGAGSFLTSKLQLNLTNGEPLKFAFHPHHAQISPPDFGEPNDVLTLQAELERTIILGRKRRYTIILPNGERFEIEEFENPQSGIIQDLTKPQKIQIRVAMNAIRFF